MSEAKYKQGTVAKPLRFLILHGVVFRLNPLPCYVFLLNDINRRLRRRAHRLLQWNDPGVTEKTERYTRRYE